MLFLVMRLQLTEHFCGRLELIWSKALVADDQHVMIHESPIQAIASFRIDRLAAIEAAHLGAGVAR